MVGYDISERRVEIQLLGISDDGVVSRRATHQLRIDCEFGGCVARLTGQKLVLFSTIPLHARTADPLSLLPAVRRIYPNAEPEAFRSLATREQIFPFPNDSLIGSAPFLNTITMCDVQLPALTCEVRVLIGPREEDYDVSPSAVYVWTHEGDHPNLIDPGDGAVNLFRVPLSGNAPQVVRLTGGPFDELSLNEDARGRVRLFASGNREIATLFTLQRADFGDGTRNAPASAARTLPIDKGESVRSQFVGSWLFYSVGGGYFRYDKPTTTLFAVRTDGGEPRRITLPYYIERIVPMDSDALVVATAAPSALYFLRIDPTSPSPLTGRFTLANPSALEDEGEGFFYSAIRADHGVLAIPGSGYGRSDSTHWVTGSTSVVFARTTPRGFAKLGSLSITPGAPESDSLEVQSGWFDDWYGNARGFFVGDRIFALIGYELIEAQLFGGRLVERRRINFMPGVDQRGWH